MEYTQYDVVARNLKKYINFFVIVIVIESFLSLYCFLSFKMSTQNNLSYLNLNFDIRDNLKIIRDQVSNVVKNKFEKTQLINHSREQIESYLEILKNGSDTVSSGAIFKKTNVPASPGNILKNELNDFWISWENLKKEIDNILKNKQRMIQFFQNKDLLRNQWMDLGVEQKNKIPKIGDFIFRSSGWDEKINIKPMKEDAFSEIGLKNFVHNFNEFVKKDVQVFNDNLLSMDRFEEVLGSETLFRQSMLVNAYSNLDSTNNNYFYRFLLSLALMVVTLVSGVHGIAWVISPRLEELYKINQIVSMEAKQLVVILSEFIQGKLGYKNMNYTSPALEALASQVEKLRLFILNFLNGMNKIINDTMKISNNIKHTSKFLAEAIDKQAKELIGATASVNAITSSIENVSENAGQSANVAEKSVNIANSGVVVVQNTIGGMDRVREQIQETAKKIKRLGESSQEIGDTVSLIDDIADQTNILALNAAIQAAMAGEYGRGFAVVADEVQRLAERSSRATKAIDTMVKTIQSDIKQVIVAMEQTTSEVIQGSRLAQDAGVALEKIVSVSKHLADLIQNISNAAQQQAVTSNKISKTMGVIQGIAAETASNSAVAAGSLDGLNDLVNQLVDQISTFSYEHD